MLELSLLEAQIGFRRWLGEYEYVYIINPSMIIRKNVHAGDFQLRDARDQ